MSGIDAAQPWHDDDRVYPGLQTWDAFTGELHAWRLRDADAKPPSDWRDACLILAQRLSELEARVDHAPTPAPIGVHHAGWPVYRDGTDPLE